jgi:periplasmic protein TonB
MKVGNSPGFGNGWLQAPLTRALLISLLSHLVLMAVLVGNPPAGGQRTLVINARLMQAWAPEPTAMIEPAAEFADEMPADIESGENVESVPAESKPVEDSLQLEAGLEIPLPQQAAPPQDAGTNGVVGKADPAKPADTAALPDAQPGSELQAGQSVEPGNGIGLLPGIDTRWYLAREVDIHPKAIGKVEPDYPAAARRNHIEGTLVLRLRIDPMGRVQHAEVVEATPADVFDEAALAAFRQARFQPAWRDGRPVRYEAYIRVMFELTD